GYLYALEGVGKPIVLQAHNVDTLIWQRFEETERNFLRRWYVANQRRKFDRFERKAFHDVSRVVAVSPDDAALAKEKFAVDQLDVVANGADVAYYENVKPAPDSQSILYLGSLDWRPNLDALRLLLDELYPAVRALERSSRLLIVGRKPPDWLRQRVAQ